MTDLTTKNDIELIEHKEPRIDSRLVAKEMGIKHKNLYVLITKHKKALREFGSLPFETETKKRAKGGTYLKFALLNENQFDSISRLTRGKITNKLLILRYE